MTPYARNDDAILARLSRPGWFESRVLPKIAKADGGCWLWTASTGTAGYGQISVGRVPVSAHRVVWIALRGEIPKNHVLDHDGPAGCGNRSCVNPDHLKVATVAENARSGRSGDAGRLKTHCPNGHPLAGDNLMPSQLKRGHRQCLTCNRAHGLARAAAMRAAAKMLGLTRREYLARFGGSLRVAEGVILARRVGQKAA